MDFCGGTALPHELLHQGQEVDLPLPEKVLVLIWFFHGVAVMVVVVVGTLYFRLVVGWDKIA